jgi:hypothetical protein
MALREIRYDEENQWRILMAMVMRKHARELTEFLRNEYGADRFEMQPGGKHPKLKFRCHGSEYSYVVGSPSDVRAIKNIEADLKRILGPPHSAKSKSLAPQEEKEVGQIIKDHQQEETPMTATPDQKLHPKPMSASPVSDPAPTSIASPEPAQAAPAARTWEIKVCAYRSGKQNKWPVVWFMFPKEATPFIQATFPGGVTVDRLDDEHWKLTASGNNKFTHYQNNRLKLTYTDRQLEPFGSSDAEAVEANGEFLIFMAKTNRKPIISPIPYPKPKPVPPIRLKVDPQPDPPPVQQINPPPPVQQIKVTVQQPMLMTTSTLMEQRMLDIIRQIYDIQELCPYKIVVLPDGRIVWRAREIG